MLLIPHALEEKKLPQRTRAGLQMARFTAAEQAKLDAGVSSVMKSARARLPSAKKRADIIKALSQQQVLVVTGDGELLMNVGALANVAMVNPPNLSILCVDNGHYGETGYQRSHLP